MEQGEKSFLDDLEQTQKASTLKVLTLLTFIGSGIELIGAFLMFAFSKYSYDTADKYLNRGNPDNLPASVGKAYTAETFEVLKKSYEYKLPILLCGVLAISLCIFGAIQMRKLKADGYWIYLIGEVLPYFASIFFIGTSLYAKPLALAGLTIPLTFIILYTVQRKNLS